MRTFKINPISQKRAILNENGLVLAKRPFLENSLLHQELSVELKRLIYYY